MKHVHEGSFRGTRRNLAALLGGTAKPWRTVGLFQESVRILGQPRASRFGRSSADVFHGYFLERRSLTMRKTAIPPKARAKATTTNPRIIETLPSSSTLKTKLHSDKMIHVANRPPKIFSGLAFMVHFKASAILTPFRMVSSEYQNASVVLIPERVKTPVARSKEPLAVYAWA